MKRNGIWIASVFLGLVVATGGGYWFGKKQFIKENVFTASKLKAEHKILYYRNPMGLPDNSPVPKVDSMGMDYIPVFADEVPVNPSIDVDSKKDQKILYYRNPMGLPDTSPSPKRDAMGMDYIPVYANEVASDGFVKISLDKVQKLGVKTETAILRDLAKTIIAVGRFQIDERRQQTVTTKFEGYIEKLYVNSSGQPVKYGQPLMEVYSPELVSAQEEYLIAWNGRQSLKNGTEESVVGIGKMAEGALKRLRNLDVSEAQIQRLQRDGKSIRTSTVYSPSSGVVIEKSAVQGMRFMPGETLFKITDLSTIWLLVDVFEQDLSLVHVGQSVMINVDAYPEKELTGKVAYIYPTINPETRTAKVRIEMINQGGMLRPDMFAKVQLVTGDTKAKVLSVPNSAIIDSGRRQVILIQRSEGLFEPREVKLGRRNEDYSEVLNGLEEGDVVVVSANFLIDAESNLKSALSSFSNHSKALETKSSYSGQEGQ